MKNFITSHFEIPNNSIDLLILFLQENRRHLSKGVRKNKFQMLTEEDLLILKTDFFTMNTDSVIH